MTVADTIKLVRQTKRQTRLCETLVKVQRLALADKLTYLSMTRQTARDLLEVCVLTFSPLRATVSPATMGSAKTIMGVRITESDTEVGAWFRAALMIGIDRTGTLMVADNGALYCPCLACAEGTGGPVEGVH